MDDKRLTSRMLGYWNRLRGDTPLPGWEKFNIGNLQDIWGQCCVWRVDVASNDRRIKTYTYEYVGESAQEALGKDLTGMVFVSHFQKFPGARIAEKVGDAVESCAPVLDEGMFVNEVNKVVKYRSCLLPFGTKDGRVTKLVLGLSWKSY